MSSLTDFLLARIAEDEQVARSASPGPWFVDSEIYPEAVRDERHIDVISGARWGGEASVFSEGEDALHLVRWNPARVLAECEAKRRIVELHQQWPVLVGAAPPDVALRQPADWSDRFAVRVIQEIEWLTTQAYIARFGHEPPTTPVLLALAQPYSDHPRFDPTWALVPPVRE